MDPFGRLSGEVGCRKLKHTGCAACFYPDGSRWLDLDRGSRSLPDRAGEGESRGPGRGARGCDGRWVPPLLPDLAGGRRAQSPSGRKRGWGEEWRIERTRERGEGFNGGRFQACDLDGFALWQRATDGKTPSDFVAPLIHCQAYG